MIHRMRRPTREEIEASLKELKAGYLQDLPSILRDLDGAISDAWGTGEAFARRRALDKAQRIAHQLVGTAGSHGLNTMSSVATHLEAALAASAKAEEPSRPTGLDSLLTELRGAARE
jgi:chemotaxis protein histidine kinase CheA